MILRISAVRRACTVVAILLISLSALPLPAAAQNSSPGSAVWLADHKHLKRIDLVTNQVDLIVSLDHEAEALAVDPAEGSVWALTEKQLTKFDRGGQMILQVDLKDQTKKLDEPRSLVFNPYDATLWVTGEKVLLHLDAQGKPLQEWGASDEIQSMGLDVDESLWLLTHRQLLHLSPQGAVLQDLDLKSYIKEPEHLAVDSLGGLLWVAGKKELIQLELNQLNQAPRSVPVPGGKSAEEKEEEDDDDDKKILALTADPLLGTLWLVTKHSLLIYDRGGSLLKTVDLGPPDLGEMKTLAFEPVSASLWLGGKKAVGRFTSNGDFVARVAVEKEAEALGVTPFRLLPTLSLLEPLDGSLTNHPRPPIRLGLGVSCNAIPCILPDAYTQALSLDVDLNGQAIGPLFSHPTGNEALYIAPSRLPEGLNVLDAQATDLFGHSSNRLTGRFTIDTIPPQFLSLSPAEGSTHTTANVLIAGAVDDPTASVMLLDGAGQGVTLGGANFSFAVTLMPGLNNFTLVARDNAGNATSVSLRLTYAANQVRVTNLTDGATVSGTHLWVIGTYAGSPNTGITVNGVIAQTHGNQFYAQVPLGAGANALTVIATTAAGELGRQTLTVYGTGGETMTVEQIPHPFARLVTIAGNGATDYNGDGIPAMAAALTPTDIAIGRDGSLYIVDMYNHRIRRVDADGVIHTVAGNGRSGFSGDGGAATGAQLNYPFGIAVGPDDSLYIADMDNNRIRRVSPEGVITTVAGGGVADETSGTIGDGGAATQAVLSYPSHVTVAPDGTLYIADSEQHRIRKVTADGIITTVAGNGEGGYNGDGIPATQASLMYPSKVTLGTDGSLYIVDSGNYRIRKVNPEGVITTVVGTGVGGYNGDEIPATQAQISDVYALALGADGALYFGDTGNQRVRKISPDGVITTIAGTGTWSDGAESGPPPLTPLDYPMSIALGADHALYIVESTRIRAFTPFNTEANDTPRLVAFKVTPAPGTTIQTIEADFNGDGSIDVTTTHVDTLLQFYYATPGAYDATFIVTDKDGRVYRTSVPVVIKSSAETDQLLRGLYTGMLDRLRVGDIESALNAVSGGMRDKYRSIFTALKPNLPTVVNQLGTLQAGTIGEEMAEYVLIRNQNGTSRAFLIYFLKGEDGVWRVEGM